MPGATVHITSFILISVSYTLFQANSLAKAIAINIGIAYVGLSTITKGVAITAPKRKCNK